MAYSQMKGSDITITIKRELKSKSYLSKDNSSSDNTFGTVLQVKAVADAIQTMETAAEYYYIDRNLALEDNYQGQRDLAIAKQFLNYGTSIGKAALLGSTLGPGGALVSAAVATAGIAVNAAIALDKQNIKITQMNSQLSFSREQAGYSLTLEGKGTNL